MYDLGRYHVGGRTVVVSATERVDGDVHPVRVERDVLAARERAITGQTWSMLDQVHGTDVVDVVAGAAWAPVIGRGDVLIASAPASASERPLAVWAADCAPIVLLGSSGTVCVAHAGWRGLASGVIDVAVDAITAAVADRGSRQMSAVLGPCIRSCCYQFGNAELAAVAAGVGVATDRLAAETRAGEPALDLPTAVVAAFDRRGIEIDVDGSCTGCDERFFSYRVCGDLERHAVIARVEEDR